MKPETLQCLQALYQQHVHPRVDGVTNLTLQGLLEIVRIPGQFGLTDQEMADVLGVPLEYLYALKVACAEEEIDFCRYKNNNT